MKIRRLGSAIAGLATVVLLATGCASSEADVAAAGGSDGDLVLARSADSTTLLPPTTTQNTDIWMLQQVYETLTLNKSDGTGVEPGLATEWTESEDGLTWTFKIREGVKFHDGSALDAEDVKFSLDYARDTSNEANAWAGEFAPITDVVVIDDHTIDIELAERWTPLPSFLALFAASIYPSDFGGHDEAWMAENANGTGPFTFDSWTKGQSLKLVKNPEYWNSEQPKIDSVTFQVVPDDNTRMLQLQGGQVDVIEEPSATTMESLSTAEGVVAESFESTKLLYFNINNTVEGLDDPKVRRALSYAVDRQSIVDTVLAGYAEPANSFISPGLPHHDDAVEGDVFDMALAQQTLAESGHPDGIPLEIQVASGIQDREQISQIAQAAWSELGFDVTVTPVDAATFSSNRAAGNFQIQIGYATSDVVDTSQMVSFLALTDDAGIRSGYTNPEVYEKAAEAVTETDDAVRTKLYSEIQHIVEEEAPIIPIVFQPSLYAFSDDVEFAPGVLGTYGLRTATISE
ncbi:ABC transporter substrate-binding protein [Brevibacterium samyangense]|uniref:ABC transporter substrate-binding protein n=1 Tax=Brevibacterium samyangense TaxID=366888 RepID=A0ABN2TLA6_9MICO